MVRLEVSQHTEHKEVAACVEWGPNYELMSGSDDMQIVRWSVDGDMLAKTTLDSCATSIAWMPSIGKSVSDLYAVSCTDGTYRLMTGNGREDRKVRAHHGAAIRVAWTFDGTALYSAGEDGELKVWSKTGNLRSTPIKAASPIYCFAIGASEEVCYACDRKVHVSSVGERKAQSWKAHEGIVLCVDWNTVNNLIVSGGEDCRYKVWDALGRQLYQSQPYAHVITSVAWTPNGAYFAVGAFNMLRLCDRTGWSCCREHAGGGSILDISWTTDGTQLAGASGTGAIVLGQLVDRCHEWNYFEVTLETPRLVVVNDLSNDTYEKLDFSRDRVVEMAVGYGHLVVTTTTQCYVYSTSNWNTPYIFDTPQTLSLVLLSDRHFLGMAPSSLTIYAYDGGRKVSQPRFHGLRTEILSATSISLAPDVVAILDGADKKLVRLFDVATGAPRAGVETIQHKKDVTFLALNQNMAGSFVRQLIVIDSNKELHVYQTNAASHGHKLQTQVDAASWHDKSEMLAAIADGQLLVWAYPQIVWIDRDLLPSTVTSKDVGTEVGKLPTIVSFRDSRLVARRADGPLVTATVSPHPAALFGFASTGRWNEALRLCQFVEDEPCWAMMAAMAINDRNLDVAEISFAALKLIDKLEYVLYIKGLPSEEATNAEIALLKRRPEDAERILLQATPPLLYRAIKLNIRLFRWGRALELAVKHRSHVDTVLAYRARYLKDFKKEEKDDRFKQLNDSVKWDWAQIKAKKDLEKKEEYARAGKPMPEKDKNSCFPSGGLGEYKITAQDRGELRSRCSTGPKKPGGGAVPGWGMMASMPRA
ncbi:hypothetical protein CTAYLR_010223 [Chrysophaeum taylorii]|uniref:Intraflagellar transport protein 80 n=1 Tax=Chrysophaeum taylorii TaxID=2483200 RepID=A0AAD7U5Z9_9STRA|nr:hypothetical protein CTAYLR_010223 [Chrysophaeum taylorii]